MTRRAARNVALMTILNALAKVGTFAYVLIGARALSKGDFGAFTFSIALGSLLAAVPGWGFDRVVIREGSARPDELNVLVAELYTWRLLVGIPAFLASAIYAAVGLGDAETTLAFLAIVLALFIDIIFTQSAATGATTRQQISGLAIAQLAQRAATAVAAAGALLAGFGLLGFSGAFLVGTFFGLGGVIIAVRRIGVRARFREMTRRGFFKMGRQSIALGFDSMLAIALLRIDAVILGIFKGDLAVASYGVAYRLLETVLFLAAAVQLALLPVMSTADREWRLRLAIERGMSVVSVVYVPFAVVAVIRGPEIISLIFGARYSGSAAEPLAWLAIAPLAFAFGALATSALVSRHHVRQAVIGSVAAAVANIAVNVAVIPILGATGAAITTTGSYLLEAGILAVFVTRRFGLPRVDRAIAQSLAAGFAMVAVMTVVHRGILIDLAVGGVIYLAVWFALTARFAPDHLELLRSFVPGGTLPPDPIPVRTSPTLLVLRRRARRIATGTVVVAASLAAGVLLSVAGARFGVMTMLLLPLVVAWIAVGLTRRVLAIVPVFVVLPASLGARGVGPLEPLDIVVLGAVGLIVAWTIADRHRPHQRMPMALGWAVATCVLGFISAALAIDSSLAARHVLSVFLAVLLAFAIVGACQRLRDVRLLVAVLLGVGAVMCAVSFSQASELRSSFGGAVIEARSTGFFGQPNELGSFAAMILMVALGVTVGRYSVRVRAAAGVVAALSVGALALSLSRGAWIGAALGLVGLVAMFPRAWRTLLAVGAVGLVVAVSLNVLRGSPAEVEIVRQRFGTVLNGSDNPYDQRPQIWSEAVREIEARPFLGFGPGNFPVASARSGSDADVSASHAHNALLTVGAELGVPAMVAVVCFTLAVGFAVLRTLRRWRSRPERALVAGLAAALLTVVGQGIVDYPLRNGVLMVLVWSITGLVLAMDCLRPAPTSTTEMEAGHARAFGRGRRTTRYAVASTAPNGE